MTRAWLIAASYPNGGGVLRRFLLQQMTGGSLMHIAENECAHTVSQRCHSSGLPSAAEYTSRHHERWRKYAAGSCSSWDRLTWGSSGRSLRRQKALMSVYCMHDRHSNIRSIVIFRTGMAERTSRVALPLQLDKYTWIPTFWHSVHICNTEKKHSRLNQDAVNFTLNSKVYSMMVLV